MDSSHLILIIACLEVFVQLSIGGVLSVADNCMVGGFFFHIQRRVSLSMCVHYKVIPWVLEGINRYVRFFCILCHQVLSSVCNKTSSYRWQSRGAEGNKQWKLNCDLHCEKICCVCKCVCYPHLPRSLAWRATLMRATPQIFESTLTTNSHSCGNSSCPPWRAGMAIHHFTGYPWAASEWLLSSLCTGDAYSYF